jgi:uncharacterized membrane protein
MARSELIHNYLAELQIYLSRVSEVQAQEVVQEIESHIYDALAMQQGAEDSAVEDILVRLGTARELAAGYIDHITIGVAPPKGLKPLSRVRKGISKGFYYLICLLGYAGGATLLLLAILKLLLPSSFGVWITEYGNSVVIAFSQLEPQANEIPALWLIPVAAMSGTGLLYLTRQIARILKMHL